MNDNKLITGIHHVTAIASGSQKNFEFYAGILGLRLVKKTVNFDASSVYHLYYGDEIGSPGSIITFFPYEGLVKGRQGKGMLNTTSFSVPLDSLDYWIKRLDKYGVLYKRPQERFKDEIAVYFEDADGLGLELVFNNKDTRIGSYNQTIDKTHAIRGFYNVEIWEEGYERTAALLQDQLNHTLIAEKGNRFRFAATDSPGNYVDLVCMPDSLKGLAGSGTVHHLAFSTPDKGSQTAIREKIVERRYNPTPILDRNYFQSIYFREPGGVLFEVATAIPGFSVDEPSSHLGENLMLPDWFENERKELEAHLLPINTDLSNYR
ncbi:MAG: ring-cleaving dioxygenase [Sporocytophaga sp.]|uniref:ring-cleaving dioxygenase n=1 Tax=Sporocytophaga sp. TaxID=2231183 RepID=UPI001B0BF863|nr:ring-cleaving dioxygenase [Sporocytophaga sp.]MBO9701881.1 ring-cleaving dioxygenase [Sporocytophaga sp.]